MSAVWIAVIAISLLGLIFGLILGYASRRFAVQDDPVVEKIDELLKESSRDTLKQVPVSRDGRGGTMQRVGIKFRQYLYLYPAVHLLPLCIVP